MSRLGGEHRAAARDPRPHVRGQRRIPLRWIPGDTIATNPRTALSFRPRRVPRPLSGAARTTAGRRGRSSIAARLPRRERSTVGRWSRSTRSVRRTATRPPMKLPDSAPLGSPPEYHLGECHPRHGSTYREGTRTRRWRHEKRNRSDSSTTAWTKALIAHGMRNRSRDHLAYARAEPMSRSGTSATTPMRRRSPRHRSRRRRIVALLPATSRTPASARTWRSAPFTARRPRHPRRARTTRSAQPDHRAATTLAARHSRAVARCAAE